MTMIMREENVDEGVIVTTLNEARYDKLRELFGDISLSQNENRTLLWLSEWSDETVNNLVSVIEKRLKNEQDKKQK
ncbi:MAG: hypothetical protein R3Y24_00155 [Eubacteriales bacterium]